MSLSIIGNEKSQRFFSAQGEAETSSKAGEKLDYGENEILFPTFA
mgnify:CR=1 FL=1